MNKSCLALALSLLTSSPVIAEEAWTDFGVFMFATAIEGDVQIRNVTSDVDVGFDGILDHLDLGFMGYIEHRRDKWSFVGEVAYLNVSDDASTASDNILQVELDLEFEQTVFEGFVGYRFHEKEYGVATLGFDLLFGARYTQLDAELSTEASLLGMSTLKERSLDEGWTDAVLAVRLQYGGRKGWRSTIRLDVGDGSDSSSKQLIALVSYLSDSNWQFFGGYRYLNLKYETGSGTSKFGVDLDYTGPMFGVSYRM